MSDATLDRLDALAAAALYVPPTTRRNRVGDVTLDLSAYTADEWNARAGDFVEFVAASRTAVPNLVAALREVLALPKAPTHDVYVRGYGEGHDDGYNRALRDIRAAITEHLGAEGADRG